MDPRVLALAVAAAHPCHAPLPQAPPVPAPLVLHTSCGSFRLARDGHLVRLPRHWLARHSGGTGRRFGAKLQIRRDRRGRIVIAVHERPVWHARRRHPSGGDVAFGPHLFAFSSYGQGVFLTDLRGPERLVARGRDLHPIDITRRGSRCWSAPASS